MKISHYIILGVLSTTHGLASASSWPYRSVHTPSPTDQDYSKTCLALEREIHDLSYQTYSYKPGFYEDPYMAATVLAGTTVAAPALVAPAFSFLMETQERGRIHSAQDRIETLRRLKAEKHCFES